MKGVGIRFCGIVQGVGFCLSGGTFQNVRLLGGAAAGLRARGFEVAGASERRGNRAWTGGDCGRRGAVNPI
jgi:hypothetical protein